MKRTICQLAALTLLSTNLSGCIFAALGAAGTATYIGVQERTPGKAVDDTVIWGKIKEKYLQQNAKDLLAGVNVEVIEGRVHLTGLVYLPHTRVDAVRLAWQVDGVKEVVNEIQIRPEKDKKWSTIATDSWISAQVRSKLLFDKNVRSINYSIDVILGVVYLMGIARNQEELEIVEDISRTTKGVEKVVSYVRIEK